MKTVWLVITAIAVLCGCGSKKRTIGDLEYKSEKEKKIEFKKLNHEEVREEYQELLNLFEDKSLKEQIERRISDIYMVEGGKKQLSSQRRTKSYYLDAIKNYRRILERYPNSPQNADVYYQLAKAYDMEGNQREAMKMLIRLTRRFPNYRYIAEAHFRKGDIYYNNKQYANAQKEYFKVTRLRNEKFRIYSHYMLAWSYYKQMKFDASLDAFSYVLNSLMWKISRKQALSKVEKPLVKDTLHSMSLALSRVGGAGVIDSIKKLQGKPYIWMVYENLGDYYLSKDRYEDSASTFRYYVQRYNYTQKAPQLHKKLIETYIKGKFPEQALEEKETYVQYYAPGSQYAKNVGGIAPEVKTQLRSYIQELAQHYHSRGQQFEARIAKKDKNDKKGPRISEKERREFRKLSISSYQKAAGYYQKFISTFPKDPKVGEMYFLKAEVLFAARMYGKAIGAYEKVAYGTRSPSAKKYRANAGYAAIISYQKLIENLVKGSEHQKTWQARSVDSMLRFASTFYRDRRSAAVLTNAAENLFRLNNYKKALEVSTKLIKSSPNLDIPLKKTAYGIMAHSHFNLENYQAAEDSYLNQRKLTANTSPEYKQISERLANTIYKKSAQLIEKNKEAEAARQLLRIKTLSPTAEVRVVAQYDATGILIKLKQWGPAIRELQELLAKYPKHKLAIEFPRKIAFAYEKNGDFRQAAEAYLRLAKADPDGKIRQDALFISAGLHKKIKNHTTAIDLYRRYARSYKQPFDNLMEARFELANLFELTNNIDRRHFWLRRIIDNDAKAGRNRTERSRWLAAWANMEYANHYAGLFKRYRLRQPLVKYLPKKNQLLKNASDRYQKAASYGIFQFVTEASFKLADLYDIFARQLRSAPKPRGLSREELPIYAEIIEEQAVPFDNLAAEIHQGNIDRAWKGEFSEWIGKSFEKMKTLKPERYNREEVLVSFGDEIF